MPIAVHHEVAGPPDGEVVVLSGSLGSRLSMWDRQLDALAAYRVVRYDLRGHGSSPVPDGPSTIADLGEDLVALLDRLEVERASLVGVSIGGMISLWTAAHHPERVRRLVPSFTAALLGPPEAWRERAALVRAEGTGAVADGVVGRWFTPAFAAREPAFVHAMRDTIAATPREGYASLCHAIETMDLRRPARDHGADAGDRRVGRPDGHAGPWRRRRPGHRRRAVPAARGRGAPRQHRARRAVSTRPCSPTSGKVRDGARSRRPAGAARGARRRARRPRGGGGDAVLGPVPGVHHARRLGRRVGAARPRTPRAQPRHAGRAGRGAAPRGSSRCTSARPSGTA